MRYGENRRSFDVTTKDIEYVAKKAMQTFNVFSSWLQKLKNVEKKCAAGMEGLCFSRGMYALRGQKALLVTKKSLFVFFLNGLFFVSLIIEGWAGVEDYKNFYCEGFVCFGGDFKTTHAESQLETVRFAQFP